MEPDVPLVIPEINADDLKHHRGIIASPNCSTTPLAMVLKALNDINPVRRVIADTYQSVSGTGAAAMEELLTQSKEALEGPPLYLLPRVRGGINEGVYPHQIALQRLAAGGNLRGERLHHRRG